MSRFYHKNLYGSCLLYLLSSLSCLLAVNQAHLNLKTQSGIRLKERENRGCNFRHPLSNFLS